MKRRVVWCQTNPHQFPEVDEWEVHAGPAVDGTLNPRTWANELKKACRKADPAVVWLDNAFISDPEWLPELNSLHQIRDIGIAIVIDTRHLVDHEFAVLANREILGTGTDVLLIPENAPSSLIDRLHKHTNAKLELGLGDIQTILQLAYVKRNKTMFKSCCISLDKLA